MTRRARGMTLTEMLVGLVLLGVVLTIVLTTSLSALHLYREDQARLDVLRNLRGTLDVLSSDVRQAGENLGADFPAIAVRQDGDGRPVLTLQRGLIEAPLPLCAPPTASTLEVTGAASNASATTFPGGISNLPANCKGDSVSLAGTKALLANWQAIITSGQRGGYLYDAGTTLGGFVTLTGTQADTRVTYSGTLPANGGTPWNPLRASAVSPPRDQRLYLAEERSYSFTGSVLQLQVNGGTTGDAAGGITAFIVTPYVQSGNSVVAATLPFPSATQPWRSLAYLEVTLQGQEPSGFGRTVTRSYTVQILPRNVSSNDR